MKSLTNLWFNYKSLKCSKSSCIITNRLFWQRLVDTKNEYDSIFLAINTLSGAIDLFNEDEGDLITKAIDENQFDDLPDRLFKFLVKRGYIFASKLVEELVFDTFINDYKKRKYSKDKILGFFSIDTSCPMGCEYCFEKKYQEENEDFEKSIMDEKSIYSAFDFLNMIKTLQERDIDFVAGWGGEPLQEKNFEANKIFIELANKNNISIAYFSNLAFIGDKLIRLLSENASNIKFLQTTIDDLYDGHDANRKLPDAFNKTVENIDKLLRYDLPVIVRTNIGANNVDSIPRIAEFYKGKGWFEFPKFKAFVTHTYDRHHEFVKSFTLLEDEAYSKYLEFRDEYPIVRKIQGIKFGPAIKNIIEAFKIRETLDVTKEGFQIDIKPSITYCFTSNRSEYVFTGAPNYSIYNCAECTGLSKFKLGTYYPEFSIDTNQADLWGMQKNSIHDIRSIDTIDECRKCRAATYCGGYCALEAINDKGTAHDVYCKKADKIISRFLERESNRLYKRARLLLDNTENITL